MTETESDDYGRVAEPARARESTDEDFEWVTDGPEFFDRLFDALASPRRRLLLTELDAHGELTLESLAERVLARERNATLGSVPDDEISRVQTSLFHKHLPKLRDYGFVDYDRETGLVALSETGERIDVPFASLP